MAVRTTKYKPSPPFRVLAEHGRSCYENRELARLKQHDFLANFLFCGCFPVGLVFRSTHSFLRKQVGILPACLNV